MKTRPFTSGTWLKSENLDDKTVVKITDATKEAVTQDDGSTITKIAIHFADYPPMLLNKTNARFLEDTLGDETDGWIGQKVTIYVDDNIIFGSKKVSGLRIAALAEDAVPF